MPTPRRHLGGVQQARGDASSEAAAAAFAAAVDGARPASPSYRVVYSSEEPLNDGGELHVERRAGSLSAWYCCGNGGTPRHPAGDAGGGDEGAPLRGSLTVVLHDDDAAAHEQGGGPAGGKPASQRAAEHPGKGPQAWETNTLYDYLKGLAEASGNGMEADSEEWVRRVSALRAALRERDSEVAALQRALEEHAEAAAGAEAAASAAEEHVAQLERRVAELEARCRALMRQLEAAAGGVADGPTPHHPSTRGLGAVHTPGLKRRLTPVAPAAAAHSPGQDSYFLQLPAQSYAEHQGCGFWESLWEGAAAQPWRWAAAACGLALLLLIILCATLVPAARRRAAAPKFLEAPAVAAAGATWLDVAARLDRPALLSYMAFRQADLNTPVPGLGRTLLELLQEEAVQAAAVAAASAPASSSDPAAAPQAGLQQLAVACGWAPVAAASADASQPAPLLSVLSAAAGAASACAAGGATAPPGRCTRCPRLEDGTAYTLLLVAGPASGRGGSLSDVRVLNAVTGNSALNVNSVEPPFTSNANATSFQLSIKLNAPGTLFYAVVHDRLYAPAGDSLLAFGPSTPNAVAVLSAQPSAFKGGLVANGSVEVTAAEQWARVTVAPPCVGAALCARSAWGLQPSTPYRVFLVAVDRWGNADPAPAVATVTTAAAAAPALLPATQPANLTATSFGMTVGQSASGGVYWLLAVAKPGTSPSGAGVQPGSWAVVTGLAANADRRRLASTSIPALAGSSSSSSSSAGAASAHYQQRRTLLEESSAPGSLIAPSCYPANRTCGLAPPAAFASLSAELAADFTVVASGCTPVPAAGQPLALPPFTGLSNNTLYHLLLATEDLGVPQPARLAPPAMFAVRTVDLSAPRLACGFPLATNVTSTSFALSALLSKAGASVHFVVLPAGAAAPTAAEVLSGSGSGGAVPAAAGNLTRSGWLPWEAAPAAGGAGDARKAWAPVGGLQGGGNYTAFFTLSTDGRAPIAGTPLAVLSGILLPVVTPPTFTRLRGLNASVDEARGTFALQLASELDRAAEVHYALYRNYSCISGDPSPADVVAGNALPASVCKCEDAAYCARAAAGSFAAPASGVLHGVGGDLSPLPFQSLRNASEAELKCFQGGLGQATDTYNIYLVAGNALPTYTGLAPQCASFAQAAAAAAAAAAGGDFDASCPAAPQLACAQSQLRADTQALQSGAVAAWRSGVTSTSGGNSSVEWQPPAGASVDRRPARVQLSLEGGAAPAFTFGPSFPADLRTASSLGFTFALDKPALLIYAVFRPMPIDASGAPQAPVLIATGRVPVFDASTNATTGAITACPWAPGGAMQSQSQFYLTFVARDKYGRMDGLCPGQAPGAAPRVCTDLAFTGG